MTEFSIQGAGGGETVVIAEVVECLPSKCKALSSDLSTSKKKMLRKLGKCMEWKNSEIINPSSR
jgi:hypothetical protein